MQSVYPRDLQPVFRLPGDTVDSVLKNILRIVLIAYGVGHVLFVPIEFVAVTICYDPAIMPYFFAFLGVLFVKYLILWLLTSALSDTGSYSSKCCAISLVLFFVLSTVAGAGIVYLVAVEVKQLGFGSVIDSPYFLDFLGFCLCTIFGSIYVIYGMPATKQQVWYTAPMGQYYGGAIMNVPEPVATQAGGVYYFP